MKSYKLVFLVSIVGSVILTGVLSCTKTDGEPPYITVRGPLDTLIELNSSYSDPGATAKDNFDDDVPVSIEVRVNTTKVGVYYVIFTAQDRAGNTATVQRTVRVGNAAAAIEGTYLVTKDCGYGITTHTEIITPSEIINNKMTFQNFFDYTSFSVDVNLVNDSILTFSPQVIKADANGDTITISNTNIYGQSKVLKDGRLVVQISEYVKSDTGSIRGVPGTKYTLNCTCIYNKQ